MRIGRPGEGFGGDAHVGPFEPAADEFAFLEVEVVVLHHGGTLPIFEDPFFPSEPVLGVGDVHGVGRAPGFKDLFTGHTDHHAMFLDVFFKGRVEQWGDEARCEHRRDKRSEQGVDDDPDRLASDEGDRFLVSRGCRRRLVVGGRF